MNAMSDEIILCPFSESHVEGALRLSREAGWPHRTEDWALTLAVSEGVVALQGGTVVGTTLCSRFGDVATLNMIIVDHRLRSRGLGRQLMERAMAAAAGCEMRLVATVEGLPLYRKLGFEAVGEIVQHQGAVSEAPLPAVAVRAGRQADFPDVVRMDTDASGMAREALLGRIATAGCLFLVDGGFALLRPFGRGHVLGPVVAREAAGARELIATAAATLPGGFLRIDMPAGQSTDCADLLDSLGLAPVGGGTVMTLRARPRPATPFQTYALVSQALG